MECSICQENLTNNIVFTNCRCNHSYHEKCINKWLKVSRTCPTCRKHFLQNPFEIDKKQLNFIKKALFYESIGRYQEFRMNNLR